MYIKRFNQIALVTHITPMYANIYSQANTQISAINQLAPRSGLQLMPELIRQNHSGRRSEMGVCVCLPASSNIRRRKSAYTPARTHYMHKSRLGHGSVKRRPIVYPSFHQFLWRSDFNIATQRAEGGRDDQCPRCALWS